MTFHRNLNLVLLLFVLATLALSAWRFKPRATRPGFYAFVALQVLTLPLAFFGTAIVLEHLFETQSPVSTAVAWFLAIVIGLAFAGTAYGSIHLPWHGLGWLFFLLPLVALLALLAANALQATDGRYALVGVFFSLLAIDLPLVVAHVIARPTTRAIGFLVVAGIPMLFPIGLSFPFLYVGMLEGTEYAEHTWEVSIKPNDPNAEYSVDVPFVGTGENGTGNISWMHLRDNVRIAQGAGTVTWHSNGTHLTIEGKGPVTVTSRFGFYGANRDREGFPSGLLNRTVSLRAFASIDVLVDWTIDMSSGTGRPCLMEAQISVVVLAGRSAELAEGPEDFLRSCA